MRESGTSSSRVGEMTIKGNAITVEAIISKVIFIVAKLAIIKIVTTLRGHTGVLRRQLTFMNMFIRVTAINRVEMITIAVNFIIRVTIIIRVKTIRLVDMTFAADGRETWRPSLRC